MAKDAEVTLFGAKFSAFANRVQIALKEKKIPFNFIEVDRDNKPQALLDANPIHKKVPTIIYKGRPLCESLVILQFLEDAWPDQVPLLPRDAYEKSQVRFWIDHIYKSFPMMSSSMRAQPGSPEKQAAKEQSVAFFKIWDEAMKTFSAHGPFFTGDKFGLLDVALAPLCVSLSMLKEYTGAEIPSLDETPRLNRWLEVVKVHPSVSAILPSEEECLQRWKTRFPESRQLLPAAPQ